MKLHECKVGQIVKTNIGNESLTPSINGVVGKITNIYTEVQAALPVRVDWTDEDGSKSFNYFWAYELELINEESNN